jgi:DNA-directed RNA polymerase specialized sigma subunit
MVKQKLAANIENLIPAIPTNQPNSLRKIEFLEAILDLQRRLKRAPTRREIEDKTEIKKNKVSEIVLEMGLEHLLSRTKATKE